MIFVPGADAARPRNCRRAAALGYAALTGRGVVWAIRYPGRCPGLRYTGLSGREEDIAFCGGFDKGSLDDFVWWAKSPPYNPKAVADKKSPAYGKTRNVFRD